jgi:hypothetical protein
LFEQTATVTLRDNATLQTLASHAVIWRNNQYQQVRLHITATAIALPAKFATAGIHHAAQGTSFSRRRRRYLRRAASLPRAPWPSANHPVPAFNALQNETARRAPDRAPEIVVVPAGNFECYRLEAYAGNARMILCIDTRFPHRIIQQVFPSIDVKLELTAVE